MIFRSRDIQSPRIMPGNVGFPEKYTDRILIDLVAKECRRSESGDSCSTESFSTFRYTSPKARARILRKWCDLMNEHQDSLARILMYENGRPISGARQEITYAASFFDWFAGEAERSYGDTVTGSTPGNRVLTIRQPVGVVGILTPWVSTPLGWSSLNMPMVSTFPTCLSVDPISQLLNA